MATASLEPVSRPEAPARRPRAFLAWVYLFLCAVYLLTGAGRLANTDAASMAAVTRSLYTHRWMDVDPCESNFLHDIQCVAGVDGRHYSGYGLVPSLLAYPAYAAGYRLAQRVHQDPALLTGAAMSLLNCLLTPLAAVLMAAWLRELGYSRKTALVGALALGLATPLWFHGVKGFFSEPPMALFLLASCYLLYRRDGAGATFLAGICFGLACGARIISIISLPVLVWYLWNDRLLAFSPASARPLWTGQIRRMAGFLAAFSLSMGLIGAANAARFGSPLRSGYHVAYPSPADVLATPFLTGLPGVLFGPEVGLAWYAPLILLLPAGWIRFRRAHSREAWLCFWMILINLLFFAKYTMWYAGQNARFLVPILPFLVLPLAPLLEALTARSASRVRRITGTVLAVSFQVQASGMVVPASRYYTLQAYLQGIGAHPWWGSSPLLHNLAALPEVLAYRPPHDFRARTYEATERRDMETAAGRQLTPQTTPNAYLAALPNSINYLAPDLWLVKAWLLGAPARAVLPVACLLLGAALLAAMRLRALTGTAESRA